MRDRSRHDIKVFLAELGKRAGIEEWLGWEWIWQCVFPAKSLSVDPRSGKVRRRHVHKSLIQKAVKHAALRVGVAKKVSCHTLRHSGVYPATAGPRICLMQYNIRTVQERQAHAGVSTTMVCTHVLNRRGLWVKSPADM